MGALVEQEILSRLEALQPNTLYFITTKSVLLQGFKSYALQGLESFSWKAGNPGVLEATVLEEAFDDRRSKVSISIQAQGLRYKCSCRAWNASQQCKHLICTLLSVINIFSPKLYYQARHDKARIQRLRSELLQARSGADQDPAHKSKKGMTVSVMPSVRQAEEPPYQLVIQTTETYASIHVRKGGKIIDSPLHLPQALSVFIFSYYSISSLLERFNNHLRNQGNHFPMILVSDYGEIPIEWDENLHFQSKTELNICEDQIGVRSLCLLNGVVSEKVVRFWNFIVDLKTGKLGLVFNSDGWRLYTEIDRLFDRPSYFDDEAFRDNKFEEEGHPDQKWIARNTHFQIPLKVFQGFQLNFTKAAEREVLNDLVLKVNGQPAPPRQSLHRHRLLIEPGRFAISSLKAQCLLGESPGESKAAPTASTFTFFLEMNDRSLPGPLKALKRQVVLCETFLKLLTLTKKESAAKVIRKALSNGDFVQYKIKRPARDLLKRYFEAFIKQDLRIWASSTGWSIAPNDKQMEAQLYRIPFELFGAKIFKDISSYHEMLVPTKLLHDRLPLLHMQCKLAGIDLHYQGKPISTTAWDFSFDAKRAAGIDWFEIKPEIRCNGNLIKDEEWQHLLEQNGVVEKDGEIHIADADTQKILKSLALIYKKEKSEDRTKRSLVQVPSLQILDWIALRKQGVRITLSDEDEALILSLVEFKTIPKIRTPRRLQATLRPYQKEGLDWLAFLYGHRFGACLADDMGLGKTIQAISLLAAIKEKIIPSIIGKDEKVGTGADDLASGLPADFAHLPHLIVVPPSLLFNWENEIERFYPELSIYSYTGKDRKRDFAGFDIVMTTYALVRRDIEKLKAFPFHIIIFDEAQAVKNVYADTTSAVRLLKSHFKLVITGTPLENHLGEYYSLIDLCLPGLLGDYEAFKSETKRENEAMLKVLIARTRPFVLRRVKDAILKELPPKVEIDIYLDLNTRQRGLYQKTVASIKSAIDNAYAQKTHAQAKIIALTAILKLRQLCISTKLLDPDSDKQGDHSPKMSYLFRQLQELLEEGHSALVFSQFTSGLDLFELDLKNGGIPFYRLDGKTPTKKRKDLVKGFQEGREPSIFLLSLKAGGQGLNLTKASYVFHLDPWWNPAVENQASDRAHRIGQKNKVTVTRLLMRHTIEEKMMFLKEKKSALYDTVMGGADKSGRAYTISKTDFDFLLN